MLIFNARTADLSQICLVFGIMSKLVSFPKVLATKFLLWEITCEKFFQRILRLFEICKNVTETLKNTRIHTENIS